MSAVAAPAVERRPRSPRSHHPASRALDRARIIDELAALRAACDDDGAFRREAVAILQSALDKGREGARRALEAGGKGRACAETLSAVEDDLLRVALELAARWLAPASGGARPTVVAVGGYGRGMLAPGSDIDLLFLMPDKPAPAAEKVVEALLYVLWDLKQKVGHATRTVDECLKQARADMTIRTTLIEARLVSGDETLFETLQTRFDREIVARTAPEFVAAKLAEREERVRRAGASRYLVEPNVKEGKGGLRDLNTLFWITKYVYRVRNPHDLIAAGVFSPREFALFRRCEEFLWSVRCRLHFLAGRAEERLSFDVQRPIARQLGYSTRAGQADVERFMKHYFLVAKDVGDLTAIVCAALEERQTKPVPVFDRFIGKIRRRPRAIADAEDFKVETERVDVVRPDAFERDPVNLIRLFWVAERSNLPIHPNAARLVTQSLKRIDARLREDPEANRLFLEILTSRHAPETALRRMNEAGVLGRFIPDFGRVVGMMQFSMYHHYTVDEHLIRAVGVLNAIEGGRLKAEVPLSSEFIHKISHRTELYLAVFLHDIAKGRPTDHSKTGADVARKLCPRLGLTPANTERVAKLIEHHLVMSNMAQGRDLSDPRTAEALAAIMQTQEQLKLMLILTVADIRAVGPGVWNGWKGQLLRTLYWETEVVLGGGHSAVNRDARVQAAQETLRRALPGWSDPEFDAYAQRHYPAYWLKVEPERQVAHAALLYAMAADLRSLATEVTTDCFRGVTAVTVVAPDHPRLLSGIAGACAAAGANIVDAQIFTTTDGLALDTIFVSRAFEREEDELRRAQRIAKNIERTLRGEVRLDEIAPARESRDLRRGAFAIEPEVTIDNTISRRYTVVEVSGLDRPGLLRDLTGSLSKLNLNIGSAHIVTFGEKAVDAFYVTDLTGQKINSPAKQAAIKRRLLADFGVER
ncbi:UTP--GlnB (protein PII) uridylyltransferase GlnD [Roseiarcus fermentans]|uniref:Bifunctional uridylyltransferase/uridylyl-removing enzyme n=1 Tax=Roseiarcus fermentans TaxID=1473586 RepID=A0A366FUA4_9HYPH|nr:[protein-PII] uridylyltransferase [Roseiarcus fermentans]RBP18101.1 UTP--GlnB (protein PII) uridylyltransferase GlnD [Roseiarcus fermentans]